MSAFDSFDKTTQETLVELEKTQKEFWNIDRETADFLFDLIVKSNSKNILEIGTSNGYSAIWLSNALKKTGGALTTIEFWDKRQTVAKKNIEKCSLKDRVEFRLGSASVVLDNIEQEFKEGKRELFDFIFIDANKSEYVEYFKKVHPLLKDGGIIAADNTLSHAKKCEPYIQALEEHPDYTSKMYNFEAGLFLSNKKTKRV